MRNKPQLIIKEQKNYILNSRVFVISILVEIGRFLFWKAYTSGIRVFNDSNYLSRFINNFKDKDKVCYLIYYLSTSFFELQYAPSRINETLETKIKKALSLATSVQKIYDLPPKTFGLFSKYGEVRYCLMIKNNQLGNIQPIVNYLFTSDSALYFIFDSETQNDNISSVFKDFKNKDEKLLTYYPEFIKLSMGCCSAEEEFKVFTNRFDKDQIKAKILGSVDIDKIEVIEK